MARDSGPTATWEERASSAIQKDRGFLRGPGSDGFMYFSSEGGNDAEFVADSDDFWMMTASAGGADVADGWAICGFIYLINS